MKEWNDTKFSGLLTSNIWQSNYEDIKNILKMKEWDDTKFSSLLTSNIWNSNYEDILKKLYLPYWNEKKYHHLLVPSIFATSVANIDAGIKLLKKYGIDEYITNRCLIKKTTTLEALIEYLINNNIDLITINGKTRKLGLNPILSCDNGQLKKKYGIDIASIEKKNRGRR